MRAKEAEYKESIRRSNADELWLEVSRMSYTRLLEEIFGDGISPQLDTLDKLKHYMIYTTKFSDIALDDIEAVRKKKEFPQWLHCDACLSETTFHLCFFHP